MRILIISSAISIALLFACVSAGPSIEGPEFAYLRELAAFTSFDFQETLGLLSAHQWTVMSDRSISDSIKMILAKSGHGEIMSVVFLVDQIYRIEIYRDVRKGSFKTEWNSIAALVRKYYNPEADAFLENVDPAVEGDLLAKIAANDGSISIGTVMKTERNPVFTCVPRVKDGSIILYLTYENESLVGDAFGK